MENLYKKCTICKDQLPATTEYFHRDKNQKDGLYYVCKKCKKIYRRKYYLKNITKKRNQEYNYKYGITTELYNELLEAQNGVCIICGTNKSKVNRKFAVDHNHETEKVRGLLCLSCNTKLGWYENNKERINKYLKGELI